MESDITASGIFAALSWVMRISADIFWKGHSGCREQADLFSEQKLQMMVPGNNFSRAIQTRRGYHQMEWKRESKLDRKEPPGRIQIPVRWFLPVGNDLSDLRILTDYIILIYFSHL